MFHLLFPLLFLASSFPATHELGSSSFPSTEHFDIYRNNFTSNGLPLLWSAAITETTAVYQKEWKLRSWTRRTSPPAAAAAAAAAITAHFLAPRAPPPQPQPCRPAAGRWPVGCCPLPGSAFPGPSWATGSAREIAHGFCLSWRDRNSAPGWQVWHRRISNNKLVVRDRKKSSYFAGKIIFIGTRRSLWVNSCPNCSASFKRQW